MGSFPRRNRRRQHRHHASPRPTPRAYAPPTPPPPFRPYTCGCRFCRTVAECEIRRYVQRCGRTNGHGRHAPLAVAALRFVQERSRTPQVASRYAHAVGAGIPLGSSADCHRARQGQVRVCCVFLNFKDKTPFHLRPSSEGFSLHGGPISGDDGVPCGAFNPELQ